MLCASLTVDLLFLCQVALGLNLMILPVICLLKCVDLLEKQALTFGQTVTRLPVAVARYAVPAKTAHRLH